MRLRYPPNNSIAIDVDGTLIVAGKINPLVVEYIERKRASHIITLWSARGEQYAIDVAQRLSVVHLFHHITGKPSTLVDDDPWGWAKFARVINPLLIKGAKPTAGLREDAPQSPETILPSPVAL